MNYCNTALQTEFNKWKQIIKDLKIGHLKTNVKMDKNIRENGMCQLIDTLKDIKVKDKTISEIYNNF